MPPETPTWLETRSGSSSVIVLAPHGGRRSRDIRRGDSVNDLYTAEIARDLAERLDATAFINTSLDRNETDLNRISHLTETHPWLLARLRDAADSIAHSGRTPLVLFVHGWNMVVACCDVGVGLRRRGGVLTGRYPTVSREAFAQTVEPLMQALGDVGLEAALGLRYPGSGKDNALQVFSGRHHDHPNADVARLAALALESGVDAIQLELGIPLRWEGERREKMLDCLAACLRRSSSEARRAVGTTKGKSSSSKREGWDIPPNNRADDEGSPVEAGYNLQAVLYDGSQDQIGLFAGVESTGPSSMACRVCLVNTDGSMNLFVAEGDWAGDEGAYRSHGLDWKVTATKTGLGASYRGPMVAYAGHDAYEDLELGLAASRLVETDLSLEFHGDAGEPRPSFGKLKYNMNVDGERKQGSCNAVLDRGGRRGGGAGPRARVFITEGLETPKLESGPDAVTFVDGDDGYPTGIEVSVDGSRVGGKVTACVPVWRKLPGGGAARFTFGTASFDWPDRGETKTAHGLYDRLEIFDPPDE